MGLIDPLSGNSVSYDGIVFPIAILINYEEKKAIVYNELGCKLLELELTSAEYPGNLTYIAVCGTSTVDSETGEETERIELLVDWIGYILYGGDVSNISPDDPTWAPTDGWSKVWQFKTSDELNDFTTECVYIKDGLLMFKNIPDELSGSLIHHAEGKYYKRIAICAYIRNAISNCTAETIKFECSDGTKYSFGIISMKYNNRHYMRLHTVFAEEIIEFELPPDWIVVVFDFEEGYCKVYNRDKEVIAEIELRYDSSDRLYGRINVWEENWASCKNDVYIDWIAVKE